MSGEWYDDRRNLAAVARYMGERGDAVDDVAYMLEKPQKFGDDWETVRRHDALTRERRVLWPCITRDDPDA